MSAIGLRVGPLIDLALHPLRGIKSVRVCERLLFLVWRDRVWHWRVSAPCTTFSIALHPALRSCLQPAGFHPGDPATREGHVLRLRTVVLALA
eukprot:5128698-Alexandrium_andersonii.AAC.2